jgi:hypothetical protein
VTVGSLLTAALTEDRWPASEAALVAAYQQMAIRHNRLGLTEPLDPTPRRFTTGRSWCSTPTGSSPPAWPP